MIKVITDLSSLLKKKGLKKESFLVSLLLKMAGYDDEWRWKIEEYAKKNRYPFKDWFDGQNRIYLPFKSQNDDISVPIDEEVESVLESNGYEITDYVGGYCLKDGRTFRIGKVLNQLKNIELKKIKEESKGLSKSNIDHLIQRTENEWKLIHNIFLNSKFRTNKKYSSELMVVFSQDPHDIAQMSYERSWSSCMELGEGSNYKSLFCEVESGGFIAYLTTTDDKEIKKPLARIHIRRFTNADGISFAKVEDRVYGNETNGFKEFVEEWVSKKNQARFQETNSSEFGFFKLRGGFYSDSFKDVEVIPPRDKEKLIQWFNEPPNFKNVTWVFEDNFYDILDEYDYWENVVQIEEFDGKRRFESPLEAANFQQRIESADYDDEWVQYILDADEYKELEDSGELEEKINELRSERFSLTKEEDSYQDAAKENAAKALAIGYSRQLDPELANSLIQYFLANQRHDNQYFLNNLLLSNPKLVTAEVFNSLDFKKQRELIDLFEQDNPEKSDELFTLFKQRVNQDLNISSNFFEDLLKDAKIRMKTNLIYGDAAKRSAASSISFQLTKYISELFSGKTDQEIHERVINFTFNDLLNHPIIQDYNSEYRKGNRDIFQEIVLGIINEITAHRNEKFDISAEIKIDLAKRTWELLDKTKWEDSGGLSVHDWLYLLCSLRSKAVIFSAEIKELLDNVNDHVKTGMINILRQKPQLDLKVLMRKEISDRIRRIYAVMDCIEKDKPWSPTYKWYQ